LHVELPALHSFLQTDDVEIDQLLHLVVDVRIGVSLESHHVTNYLSVGLAIVAIVRIALRPEYQFQRALHCSSAQTRRAEECAVDVE
jgi:hypothetical protein